MTWRARKVNVAYRRAFGQNLRELRTERGVSQEALALCTGIAKSYMAGIQRGKKNPALEHIVRLAADLDVAPADLMPPVPPTP